MATTHLFNISVAVTGVTTTQLAGTTTLLQKMTYMQIIIGSCLAIGGNLLISISLTLQKHAHMKNAELDIGQHYTRNWIWWVGMMLMIVGEIGNFSAYGFAPVSLVAPLGTTTVLANLVFAVVFLKEKVKVEHLFGSTLAVTGAFLIVTFSSRKDPIVNGDRILQLLVGTAFIIYSCSEMVLLGVLLFLLYKIKFEHVVIYLLIASTIASFTVISAKGVSSMLQLTMAGNSQLNQPVLYVMIIVMAVTAVIQVKFLNDAMRKFNVSVVVPTNFVFFSLSVIVAGIVFYKEFWGMSGLQVSMFLLGCFLSFVGVYVIAMGSKEAETKSEVDDNPNDTKESIIERLSAEDTPPSWLLHSIQRDLVQPQVEIAQLSDVEDQSPILPKRSHHRRMESSLIEQDGGAVNYGSSDAP